jgi:hypothetical protein
VGMELGQWRVAFLVELDEAVKGTNEICAIMQMRVKQISIIYCFELLPMCLGHWILPADMLKI